MYSPSRNPFLPIDRAKHSFRLPFHLLPNRRQHIKKIKPHSLVRFHNLLSAFILSSSVFHIKSNTVLSSHTLKPNHKPSSSAVHDLTRKTANKVRFSIKKAAEFPERAIDMLRSGRVEKRNKELVN